MKSLHMAKPSFRQIDSLRVTTQFSCVQFILLHFLFGRRIEFVLTKRQTENCIIHHRNVPINRLIKDFLHKRLTHFAFWSIASKIICATVFGVSIDLYRCFCLFALFLARFRFLYHPPPPSRFLSFTFAFTLSLAFAVYVS